MYKMIKRLTLILALTMAVSVSACSMMGCALADVFNFPMKSGNLNGTEIVLISNTGSPSVYDVMYRLFVMQAKNGNLSLFTNSAEYNNNGARVLFSNPAANYDPFSYRRSAYALNAKFGVFGLSDVHVNMLKLCVYRGSKILYGYMRLEFLFNLLKNDVLRDVYRNVTRDKNTRATRIINHILDFYVEDVSEDYYEYVDNQLDKYDEVVKYANNNDFFSEDNVIFDEWSELYNLMIEPLSDIVDPMDFQMLNNRYKNSEVYYKYLSSKYLRIILNQMSMQKPIVVILNNDPLDDMMDLINKM